MAAGHPVLAVLLEGHQRVGVVVVLAVRAGDDVAVQGHQLQYALQHLGLEGALIGNEGLYLGPAAAADAAEYGGAYALPAADLQPPGDDLVAPVHADVIGIPVFPVLHRCFLPHVPRQCA